MTTIERIVENYYQDPQAKALAGIDWPMLEQASRTHRQVIQRAWDGQSIERLPILLQPTRGNYRWDPEQEVMVYHDALRDQLEAICDAIREGYLVIPSVQCDFNTLPVSALFGAQIEPLGNVGLCVKPQFETREAIEALEAPEVDSGLVSIMFRETERFRRILPDWFDVGVRLNTGPISVAAELRGTTDLLYDMMEASELYHRYMSIITDTYIAVRRGIHERAKIRIEEGVVRPDVPVHAPTTGAMICDDTIQLLSPELFESCAAPYLNRIFQAFGGGSIHSCGNVSHLLPAFAGMPLLAGVEFGQASLMDWSNTRAVLPDKVLIYYVGKDDATVTTFQQAADQLKEPRTFMYNGLEEMRYWQETGRQT